MSKLDDFYRSIESLTNMGVEITNEQWAKLDEFEEEEIKKEVLPALSNDITPRLSQIKRDLVLVVEYHPGEPINVALSRKVKISDFSDAKQLIPLSRPVSGTGELVKKHNNEEPTKTITYPTKGLKVTFPNGKVIWFLKAIDTFVATLKEVGFERVSALGITHAGYNLVGHKKRTTKTGTIWQHECDGWYIYSNMSNSVKVENLKRISDHYNLHLVVEEIKPDK